MADYADGERVAGSLLLSPKKIESLSRLKRNRCFNYKTVLLLVDTIMAFTAFALGARIGGFDFDFNNQWMQTVSLAVFALTSISFFITFDLYSYHRIFSQKLHLIQLGKSLVASLVTILLIVALYAWPQVLDNMYFVPLLFLFALVLLLLSRFLSEHLLNILRVFGLSFFATGIFSLMDSENVPAIITNGVAVPLGFVFCCVLVVALRMFLVHVVFSVWMSRSFRRQVLIVGSNVEAEDLSNHIIANNAPFWVCGIVGPKKGPGLNTTIPKLSLGGVKRLPDIFSKTGIDDLIVTDETIDKTLLVSLVDFCISAGTTVWFQPKLMPIIDIKLVIDNFCGIQMIRLNTNKNMWVFNKVKHTLDALITLPCFILLLPLFTLIAVAIKLDSKGPVFYKAESIGKSEKPFLMYKYRSMQVESSCDMHKDYVTRLIKGEIDVSNCDEKPIKITDDPRVTRVGRLLRKLSLDELPQLLNVIKGEMSLVGPRPCLPYEYEVYQNWHKKRTLVRPGITGLWQVAGRSSVAFDDMILLDLYYIYNRSLEMDFSTLFETIFVVLKKKGAY
jgi:exopolysaccharide biosynthesis polyprenyl glycosylphosphotransferase